MLRRCVLLPILAIGTIPIQGGRQICAVPEPVAPMRPLEWPMFGGTPARNLVSDEHVIVSEWSIEKGKERNIRWRADLGSRCHSCPVIAGGKVFIGTNNENPRNKRDRGRPMDDDPLGPPLDKSVLMCFDERTGEFLWQAVHDKLTAADLTRAGVDADDVNGTATDWPRQGNVSTPCVEGRRIYYLTSSSTVICADTEGFLDGANDGVEDEKYKDKIDADMIWRFDMIAELKIHPHCLAACSPLIVGDRLFVVTGNGVGSSHEKVRSPDAPSFIALDKKTGKLLWKSNLPGKNIMHGQWSSPAFGIFKGVPTVIFPGGDGWLYGLKPENGELIWKFYANPKDAMYEIGGKGTKSDFIGMPVVYNDRIFIGLGQDPEHYAGVGHFWCIDPAGKTGDISPELVTDANVDPPKTKPNPNSGVFWHYGGVDKRKGSPRDFHFGRTMSTACIVDDLVYIPEIDGYVHCLNANTGKLRWLFDARASIWGSCLYCDGKVYMANEDGDVFIFRHNTNPDTIDPATEALKHDDEKIRNAVFKGLLKHVGEVYLSRKIPMEECIQTTPTVANDVLYIASERTLFAISNKKR
jgi:outer membrane protein assembly factor BamB